MLTSRRAAHAAARTTFHNATSQPLPMSARIFLCLVLVLTLGACTQVPARVARELAPPDPTTPDHFRLRGEAHD